MSSIDARPHDRATVTNFPIRQIGVVVSDLAAAMCSWTELTGIGPFVVLRNFTMEDGYRYKGNVSKPPIVDLALAFSNGIQFELIQQLNDAPSAFLDFLAAGQDGVQHLSPQFSTPEEYDAAYAQLVARGLQISHEGTIKGTPFRFAYFATADGGCPQYEISETRHPALARAFERIELLNEQWDGTTPAVIDIMDLSEMDKILGLED